MTAWAVLGSADSENRLNKLRKNRKSAMQGWQVCQLWNKKELRVIITEGKDRGAIKNYHCKRGNNHQTILYTSTIQGTFTASLRVMHDKRAGKQAYQGVF